MVQYIVRRILQTIPVLFLISLVSFALMQAAPGGPQAAFNQNPKITPAQIDAWLGRWCLARNPDAFAMLKEYAGWLGVIDCSQGIQNPQLLSKQGLPNILPAFLGGGTNGVLHGDLGFGIASGRSVLALILERLPATMILMFIAFVIWVSVALIAGVIAAVKRYSFFDQSLTFVSYILFSLPTFWLGLVLIFVFAVSLRWFPTQGILSPRTSPGAFGSPVFWAAFAKDPLVQIMDIARHLVLPVATLVAVNIAADSRFVRAAMLETLSQDYVRTAKAKGLGQRSVVFRHAFRNALLPVLTNVSLEFAFLFSGAIVTEQVFSWPGMGRLFIEGIAARDYFLLMGLLLFGSVLVVLFNLIADVLYAFADPRIRY